MKECLINTVYARANRWAPLPRPCTRVPLARRAPPDAALPMPLSARPRNPRAAGAAAGEAKGAVGGSGAAGAAGGAHGESLATLKALNDEMDAELDALVAKLGSVKGQFQSLDAERHKLAEELERFALTDDEDEGGGGGAPDGGPEPTEAFGA